MDMEEDKINEINQVIDDLNKQLSELSSRSSKEAKEYFSEMKDKSKKAMEKAREAGNQAKEFVEDHPWESIGIGAALGLLIGIALGSRTMGKNKGYKHLGMK